MRKVRLISKISFTSVLFKLLIVEEMQKCQKIGNCQKSRGSQRAPEDEEKKIQVPPIFCLTFPVHFNEAPVPTLPFKPWHSCDSHRGTCEPGMLSPSLSNPLAVESITTCKWILVAEMSHKPKSTATVLPAPGCPRVLNHHSVE